MIQLKIQQLILVILATLFVGSSITYLLVPKRWEPSKAEIERHNNFFKPYKPKTTGGETVQDWIDPLISGQKTD
jgi:hypothetical protein